MAKSNNSYFPFTTCHPQIRTYSPATSVLCSCCFTFDGVFGKFSTVVSSTTEYGVVAPIQPPGPNFMALLATQNSALTAGRSPVAV